MPATYDKDGLLQLMKDRVQDAGGALDAMGADGLERFIDDGLNRYSRDRAHVQTDEYEVTVASPILDTPEDWEPGFSSVSWIEYPIDITPEPSRLDERLVRVDSAASEIRIGMVIAVGESYRIRFTTVHRLDGWRGATDTTIPAIHFEAVAIAASVSALRALAARYSDRRDPSTPGQRQNHPTTKTDGYLYLARDLDLQYASIVAPPAAQIEPESADLNLDITNSLGGEPLFYPDYLR